MTKEKAPDSYVDERRPLLGEALDLEGKRSHAEAVKSLEEKGYFTAQPRPWKAVGDDRHGTMSSSVLDRFGDVVCRTRFRASADLIVQAVAEFDEKRVHKGI